MEVSGFTFVKDGMKFRFPVVESIRSMLPLCDEVIVNVGLPDTDGTLASIEEIHDSKIRILTTEWDPFFKVAGRILAQQTNIALYRCRGDWCLYLQADEVLHEEDYGKIRRVMERNLGDERVEGLLFDYVHFFGDYRTYVKSYHWYRKEVRIVRNHLGITSWRSAQGFRLEGRKLRVKETGGRVFHYGWVRPTKVMREKKSYHDQLHHGEAGGEKYSDFEFQNHVDPYLLGNYTGTHPKVMERTIEEGKFKLDRTASCHKMTLADLKCRLTDAFARITGVHLGEYKNYRLLQK
jgi:hypothetical protein